jgi:hypothetical protein
MGLAATTKSRPSPTLQAYVLMTSIIILLVEFVVVLPLLLLLFEVTCCCLCSLFLCKQRNKERKQQHAEGCSEANETQQMLFLSPSSYKPSVSPSLLTELLIGINNNKSVMATRNNNSIIKLSVNNT